MDLTRRLKNIHLRLVLQVALTGKLQTAADEIALSQPAASRMLAEIEKVVGATLFTRHAKGMVPTPIGEAVVRHARQIIRAFDNLEMDVAQISSGRAGSVRIGTVTGPAVGLVVPVVRAMREQRPEVEFTIEVAPSASLMRGLDEGIFDFVVGRPAQDYNRQSYRIYPARSEVVSMLVYRDHPMAKRKAIRLRELNTFDWIIQDHGTPIRAAVEAAFLTNRVMMPSQITNTSSLLVALALLEQSTAVAPQSQEVVELLTVSALDMNVVRLDVVEDVRVSPFFVVARSDRELSPLAEHVILETTRNI
ncbi:LysR family transcriptional regulator [Shimia sp.]|uniref:LysR family transcriptional regulator n=1 Tax=Shimia sp. TaxID=1954381 RepID=UPI003B8C5B74